MFAVNDILISDAVLDAPFVCVLGACHGHCCMQGDAGAPLRADDGACVFAAFDGPVATCALHRAHQEGRTDFIKPLSCHLFPIRIGQVGPHQVLNVQHLSICAPARAEGQRPCVQLADLLRAPLIRAYGTGGYDAFHDAWTARRQADSSSSRAPETPC